MTYTVDSLAYYPAVRSRPLSITDTDFEEDGQGQGQEQRQEKANADVNEEDGEDAANENENNEKRVLIDLSGRALSGRSRPLKFKMNQGCRRFFQKVGKLKNGKRRHSWNEFSTL